MWYEFCQFFVVVRDEGIIKLMYLRLLFVVRMISYELDGIYFVGKRVCWEVMLLGCSGFF